MTDRTTKLWVGYCEHGHETIGETSAKPTRCEECREPLVSVEREECISPASLFVDKGGDYADEQYLRGLNSVSIPDLWEWDGFND